ncbi:hypothetical protein LOAG_01520 [Loa loa]|uniref:Uncharacterized protein n=1 Tax=Loa loa TaxID=7209 RepID=A0A1S0U996_LOALO|nr:hypothetical protein LOAG_01520 [Loa loa]EFO26963.1 hypothetical protein LOAG_01520 [Loa loa]
MLLGIDSHRPSIISCCEQSEAGVMRRSKPETRLKLFVSFKDPNGQDVQTGWHCEWTGPEPRLSSKRANRSTAHPIFLCACQLHMRMCVHINNFFIRK